MPRAHGMEGLLKRLHGIASGSYRLRVEKRNLGARTYRKKKAVFGVEVREGGSVDAAPSNDTSPPAAAAFFRSSGNGADRAPPMGHATADGDGDEFMPDEGDA